MSRPPPPPSPSESPGDAPRRVVLVLHKFSQGGSDRVAAHLASGFQAAGVDTSLLVIRDRGEVDDALCALVAPGVAVHYLTRARGPRPLDLLRGVLPLVRALRRLQPDAVISTANNTSLLTVAATRLALLRRARVYLKTTNPIASSRHRGIARALRRWSYRLIFRWTDRVWTLTAAEADEMRQAFPQTPDLFTPVINPYVTPVMLSERPAAARRRGVPTVIAVARLTAQKRLDRLIAGFAHVRTPGARLVILGEGEDRAVLAAQVRRAGLAKRVALPGYTPDVATALRAADLFVMTSAYEGLPAAILEAMASDCPVLSTDCFPGARELIGPAPGCAIIDDVTPQALGRQIDRHLSAPRPPGLRHVAARYAIAAGVASHLAAMTGRPARADADAHR